MRENTDQNNSEYGHFLRSDTHAHNTDVTKHLSMANTDIFKILKGLRLSYPKNIILLCLNVKSVKSLTIFEKS